MLAFLMKSQKSNASSEHRGRKKPKRWAYIISHDSLSKVIWDWIVLLMVIFTAIQIPYFTAFESDYNRNLFQMLHRRDVDAVLILGLLVDCMFIMDIFINFFTTYVASSSSEVVEEPALIAIHYLKTWFLTDLLAGVPLDWMLYEKEGSGTPTLVGLLKSARLLRLFRVARKLDRYSEYGVAVLVLLMALFTLFAHWFACIWNGIAIFEKDNPQSWAVLLSHRLYGNDTSVKLSTKERYSNALYFVMSSMTSVGYGNISANTTAEQVFCVLLMLFGALMYACIFGSMVAIIQRLYSKASSFHNHVNIVREFLKSYKIPQEIRRSVNSYVRREWSSSHGVDFSEVLRHFPDCMQADIKYELYKPVFVGARIFDGATVSCMRALAMKFFTINLQTDNYCLRQGEEIDRLYIIGKGSLEILIDGDLITILAKNSMFGYDFISCPEYPKSSANVRASNMVEIHCINKTDLLKILHMYPNFAKSFQAKYKPGYYLCDEAEEGSFQTATVKPKSHVIAVAKHALAMPIMARWSKKEKPQSMMHKSSDEKRLINALPSEYRMNGLELRKVHCILDDVKNLTASRKLETMNSISDESTSIAASNASTNPYLNSDHLLLRLISLENDVTRLSKDLNEKMDQILKYLARQTEEGPSETAVPVV